MLEWSPARLPDVPWDAVSAFANCGRAVAHVQGSYVPKSEINSITDLSAQVGRDRKLKESTVRFARDSPQPFAMGFEVGRTPTEAAVRDDAQHLGGGSLLLVASIRRSRALAISRLHALSCRSRSARVLRTRPNRAFVLVK